MAIRFRCGACAQPIEVDDEWALRTVACPYCRKTITAPAESTLEELSEIPTASPLQVAGTPPPAPQPISDGYPSEALRSNKLAPVALILAVGSVVLLLVYIIITSQHLLELEPLLKAPTYAEQMKAFSDLVENNPPAVRWMVTASLAAIVGGLAALAAIVCAVIALRRPQAKGMALGALAIAGVLPIFLCCGGLLGGAGL